MRKPDKILLQPTASIEHHVDRIEAGHVINNLSVATFWQPKPAKAQKVEHSRSFLKRKPKPP